MKVSFLGAAKTVTGSKYLIEHKGRKFLVDCGMFQGPKDLRQKNWLNLPIEPSSVKSVLLTHAHIDHSGYLPKLVKDGFEGKIFSTQETIDLCKILLPDCAYVMEETAEEANQNKYSKHNPALPLYTVKDANRALESFHAISRDIEIDLGEGLFATFKRAGHILGANILLLHDYEKDVKIGFSGDLGRPADPIMYPPDRFQSVDYLFIESTYGDRVHTPIDPVTQLEEIIDRTLSRGGTIVVPAFAVGRTQSLLYYLHQLKSQKRIPNVPIFLDSPLATNASDLYVRHWHDHKLKASECKEIFDDAVYLRTRNDSLDLRKKKAPMMIIAGSGMATGGRVLYHLKRYLPDANSTILFSGFQVEGTRGADLVSGKSEIKIHGELIPVKAEIINLASMSAHADSNEIIDWLRNSEISPKKVFITHGEIKASESLKMRIESNFKWECVIPDLDSSFEFYGEE